MESEYWDPHHNYLTYGGVAVAEFQTEAECYFALYLLDKAGIKAAVLLPGRQLDLRLPGITVKPEDEAQARQVLAAPISSTARAEYDNEPEPGHFVSPTCPSCNSPDVVLNEVTNGNCWHCEVCGKDWTELPQVL